ncbi:MAG: hypothetical protein H6648_01210 [Caldilineae bacterium]|nr:hypothetical protein [Chloroflexota bacterium]MCB9175749.1 hypothetical protein [Caldilineae bacterium]
MSPAMRETIDILANLAGSFLLLLLFLGLVLACVLVWFLGRGLKLARGRTREIAVWILGRLDSGRSIVDRSARQVLDPQIEALSTWTGLKAGWRALRQGTGSALAERGDGDPNPG